MSHVLVRICLEDMRTMQQLIMLTAASLVISACDAKRASPQARDGATDQGSDTGVGGGGNGGASLGVGGRGGVTGTGGGGTSYGGSGGASNGGGTSTPATGGTGGNSGIANDADGARDTFFETRADGSDQDSPDAASDDTMTGDGALVVDLRITEIGVAEAGAAACGAAGTACTGQLGCSSGDDIDVGCRSALVCQNDTWTRSSFLFIRCGATTANDCPNALPTEGSACTLAAQLCSYATGTCTCATGCESGTDAGPCQKPKTWHCDLPPPAGCPIQAPHLGMPCAQEKTACSYGGYCAQYRVSCQGGYWEPNGFMPFGGCV
jgi:hypothetical protein